MITRTEFISEWKTHLLFGGGFLAAIAFTVVVNMLAGEHFAASAWSAVREIRPMEVIMLVGLWYSSAFYHPKAEWSSSFTTLNLGSKDEKHIDACATVKKGSEQRLS